MAYEAADIRVRFWRKPCDAKIAPKPRPGYVEVMTTITVEVADPVYAKFLEQARRANRPPAELIREALSRYVDEPNGPPMSHSVVDIPSFPLGPPLKPWASRAEMLEGFMDDRG